ncbi:MAG: hypothetical protein ACLFWF_12080 [Alphaproteobacteria bacterium]
MSSEAPRPRPLAGGDRLFAWTTVVAVAFVHLYLTFSGTLGLMDRELGDTDAYTWMVRATDLMKTGDWFDATLDRVNPPEGLDQHWTRPLDTLIVAGALPLSLFMGTDDALFVSGAMVSPLLHLAGLALLMWGAAPLLGRGRVPLLGILYLAQVGILSYSAAGRPDHHALIFLATSAILVLSLRVAAHRPDRRLSLGLGAVMVLGLWSGIETLVTVFGSLTGFGVLWLMQGRAGRVAEKMQWTGIGAVAAGTVALFLERGGAMFSPAYEVDSISAFHLFLLAVTAAFWTAIRWAENRRLALTTMRARAGLAAGLTALAALALALVFPQFLAFELVPMDPFYRQTRFANIQEYQPLISAGKIASDGLWTSLAHLLLQIGILLPALGFLVWALVNETDAARRAMWTLIACVAAVMLVVYSAENGLELRDTPLLQLIALIPYTELCFRIVRRIGARFSGLRRSVVRPVTIMLLIGWFLFPAAIIAASEEDEPAVSGRTACPVKQAAPALRGLNDPSRLQIVMAFVDFGPELMYRTPHAILTMPNHHKQPGYRLTWDAMTAENAQKAGRLIRDRGVDFLLLCDSPLVDSFYAQLGAQNTFREALIAGDRPEWLREVPLPEGAGGLHLFQVRK